MARRKPKRAKRPSKRLTPRKRAQVLIAELGRCIDSHYRAVYGIGEIASELGEIADELEDDALGEIAHQGEMLNSRLDESPDTTGLDEAREAYRRERIETHRGRAA